MLVLPHSGYLDNRVTDCTVVTLAVDQVYIDNNYYYCSLLDALHAVCADAAIVEFCSLLLEPWQCCQETGAGGPFGVFALR